MNNRREFLSRAAALAAAATIPLLPASAAPATPLTLPSLKGRKVLLTYGGWPGHEPEKFNDYMSSWLKEEGADVQSFPSLDPYTDKALMANIDLVIQIFTMSQISKEQEAGLLTAIRENGTGMAGWHGGMGDSFRNNVDYQFMVGGQWVQHPGNTVD
ncbi:MAG TPA: ThuA domain-containing protein, partial [Cyclobacteriaceae bacterium]